MKVKAAAGLKCPMEGQPRQYITDEPQGTDVPDTAYYRRLVADGSLELVTPPAAKTSTKTSTASQGGEGGNA